MSTTKNAIAAAKSFLKTKPEPKSKPSNMKVLCAGSSIMNRRDMYNVDPSAIQIDVDVNFNPRSEYTLKQESWDSFKANILLVGLTTPIEIYIENGIPFLSHGFRRLTAVLELIAAGKTVPNLEFRVVPKNRENMVIRHFLLNADDAAAKPLTPVEKGRGMKHLRDVFGMNMAQISKAIDTPYAQVKYFIDLVDGASVQVIQAIETGELAVATAKKLVTEAVDTVEQNLLLDEGRQAAQEEADAKVLAAAEAAANKPPRKPRVKKEVPADELPVNVDPETGELLDADTTVPTLEVPKIKMRHIEKLAVSTITTEVKIQVVLDRAVKLGDAVDQDLVERIQTVFNTLILKGLEEINEKTILAMFEHIQEKA